MQTKDQSFLGTEPVGKLLVRLAVPTVIAQLVNMLYNIVDRIYIGHMPGDGSLALTGIGVCMPIILVVSAFASFSATGGAPRASIFMGRGDHDNAEKTLGGCFTLQLGISAVLTAALLFVSNYLVNYAIGRSGDGGNREVALEVEASPDSVEAIIETNRAQYSADIDAFAAAHPGENVTLTAADGLTLHGVRYANAETADTHRWAIVLHGYRGNHTGVLNLAMPYYEAGYQVIAPDLRACGDSDGDYVGMGWLDREDILRWIDFILAEDPQAEIVVHGISMGAATTMMTAGEDTPENVKVFIEDCGYTSVWDVFSSELQLRFGLPEFPILYTASGVAKLRAGYTFGEASALRQVENCEKPMLFIHGTADDFIPYEMMDELYNAKPGDNKAELTADGAGHGEAMYALGDTYWDTVFDFIEPYMN